MSNVGRIIQDFYCNGYAGRRYDMAGARIEAEAHDWVIARTRDGDPVYMEFNNYKNGRIVPGGSDKQYYLDKWCSEPTQDW